MPRLNVVDPNNAQGEAKEIFEGPLKGKHLNLFKGMANSPAALNACLGISGALAKGKFSAKERETIALVFAELNDCDYCLAAHTTLGKKAGLSEEETLSIRSGGTSDPKLDALAKFASAIHSKKGFVSDEDIDAFRDAGYDDGHIAEVAANVALNVYTNYFNHINDTEVDFPKAPALSAT